MRSEKEGRGRVLTLSESEYMQMRSALLDDDGDAALQLIRIFVKRLHVQNGKKLKSHLDAM